MDEGSVLRARKLAGCMRMISLHDSTTESPGQPPDADQVQVSDEAYIQALIEYLAVHDCDTQSIERMMGKGAPTDDEFGVMISAVGGPGTIIPYKPTPPEAGSLYEIGQRLHLRFSWLGSPGLLSQAMELYTEAVRLSSWDHTVKPLAIAALGMCHGKRYEIYGFQEDLDCAIRDLEVAAEQAPTQESRSCYLLSLGNQRMRLWERKQMLERTRDTTDLASAFDVTLEALRISKPVAELRASQFNALATQLGLFYEVTNSLLDVDSAIFCGERSVSETKEQDTEAAFSNNLAVHYERRYLHMRRTNRGSLGDLDRAITLARFALDKIQSWHPDHAVRLNNLAHCLHLRYEATQDRNHDSFRDPKRDLLDAIDNYKAGWRNTRALLSLRVAMARDAAKLYCLLPDWQGAHECLQRAVELLPQVSPYSLTNTDKRAVLAQFSGTASLAAAVALQAGKTTTTALRMLEEGRGIISSLLMGIRSDASSLHFESAEIAAEYAHLRKVLDSQAENDDDPASSGDGFVFSPMAYRRAAECRLKELVGTPSSSQDAALLDVFLHRSPALFQEVGSNWAVVVLNVSSVRCDAFLLDWEGARAEPVPLPVTEAEIEKKVDEMEAQIRSKERRALYDESLLQWLWRSVAGPVLHALGYDDAPAHENELLNVWWIATGPLSRLPIHAAGYHSERAGRTVLDRAISSYAPSLKALLQAPRRRWPAKDAKPRAVLVGKQYTARMRPLPFVDKELRAVERLVSGKALEPLRVRPKKYEILAQMPQCDVLHFAGHGLSHPRNPSLSHLVLDDEPLTVEDLLDNSFQEGSPFLGYLSACSTASNASVHEADEAFHLVSALQLAGFRHVVGTLWPVLDRVCVRVAAVLYRTLERRDGVLTDASVRVGLHRAIKGLRDEFYREDAKMAAKGVVVSAASGSPDMLPAKTPASWVSSAAVAHPSQNTSASSEEAEPPSLVADEGSAVKRTAEVDYARLSGSEKKNRLHWVPYIHYGP